MKPAFITFTGVDDRANLHRMDQIASWFPVEWGILFSPGNRDARYPCHQAVKEILAVGGRKAAHLCGGHARDLAECGYLNHLCSDYKGKDAIPLAAFGRAQLNGVDLPRVHFGKISAQYVIDVILQSRTPEFPDDPRCSFLYDASGGTGMFPESVPARVTGRMVGYAGGMGPDTVLDYLRLIEAAGGEGDFWIDMEGRVRTNGWFDLVKVERVCERVFA